MYKSFNYYKYKFNGWWNSKTKSSVYNKVMLVLERFQGSTTILFSSFC